MSETSLIQLNLRDAQIAQALYGPNDLHLKRIEEELSIELVTRGEDILITGDKLQIERAAKIIETLIGVVEQYAQLSERDVFYAIQLEKEGKLAELNELYDENIATTVKGKIIRAKTLGQRHYVSMIRKHDMVFGVGPAGTGKTYLAVVSAVSALKEGKVNRIVLTRPAVEAGESLGFLPGDLKEKVDPYLRPIYDALHDVLGVEHTTRLMERGTIEVAPLAYMRGRTLDDSFVILDEAQNTTEEQIKMFITRLGFGSKMVINGDITQIDLPKGKKSGLQVALHKLRSVKGIGMVYLQASDVVRHVLVQRILQAYEQNERLNDQ
ncbi:MULTISPECIES: PhoH family protein [Shouchella]|uniref:PhoH-like protein n=2 Tax=Shouchella TaxID=2893057 RepID=A0ABY7W261_9BACI|nr:MULTISPECIES: PhoH family protein [Shouchella]MED4127883.1 PhoH family protein [Shouchella miscanthi]WDF03032.1 PhoH family protein [Shouchella hunanensis]GAF22954.1 phosphate starvation-inducible protein PhoH, predicted ATPase [Bacillus sp. JCM 19047]